jgi:hypothetical protein
MAKTSFDRATHTLNCDHCGSRRVLRRLVLNPERMAIAAEQFAAEHADCHKYSPRRARAELRLRRATRLMQARAMA